MYSKVLLIFAFQDQAEKLEMGCVFEGFGHVRIPGPGRAASNGVCIRRFCSFSHSRARPSSFKWGVYMKVLLIVAFQRQAEQLQMGCVYEGFAQFRIPGPGRAASNGVCI